MTGILKRHDPNYPTLVCADCQDHAILRTTQQPAIWPSTQAGLCELCNRGDVTTLTATADLGLPDFRTPARAS